MSPARHAARRALATPPHPRQQHPPQLGNLFLEHSGGPVPQRMRALAVCQLSLQRRQPVLHRRQLARRVVVGGGARRLAHGATGRCQLRLAILGGLNLRGDAIAPAVWQAARRRPRRARRRARAARPSSAAQRRLRRRRGRCLCIAKRGASKAQGCAARRHQVVQRWLATAAAAQRRRHRSRDGGRVCVRASSSRRCGGCSRRGGPRGRRSRCSSGGGGGSRPRLCIFGALGSGRSSLLGRPQLILSAMVAGGSKQ